MEMDERFSHIAKDPRFKVMCCINGQKMEYYTSYINELDSLPDSMISGSFSQVLYAKNCLQKIHVSVLNF